MVYLRGLPQTSYRITLYAVGKVPQLARPYVVTPLPTVADSQDGWINAGRMVAFYVDGHRLRAVVGSWVKVAHRVHGCSHPPHNKRLLQRFGAARV